jgi:DNA-binding CsgD family transcriptional regulator
MVEKNNLSFNILKNILQNIYNKLGVINSMEAVRIAILINMNNEI